MLIKRQKEALINKSNLQFDTIQSSMYRKINIQNPGIFLINNNKENNNKENNNKKLQELCKYLTITTVDHMYKCG